MPVLIWIARFFFSLLPFFKYILKFLSFIWQYVKVIALHPVAWITMALAPTISLIVELFTGHPSFLSGVITGFITQIVNKILTISFDVDVTELVNTLPVKVLEVSCYLGAIEAIQIIINGIVSAMTILLTLRFNLFIAGLKIRFATMKRM